MNKSSFFDIDWALVAPVLIIVILSLTTLFSIDFAFFKNQLIFFVISVLAFLLFSQINYRLIQKSSFSIYVFSVIILVLLLIIGKESRGSVRWFEIFEFRIQFSEVLKPFLAISLSSFLGNRENSSYKTFFISLALLSPIVFLIFMQPDLGNVVVYMLTVLLTMLVYGFPLRIFLLIVIMALLAVPVFWNFLYSYQKQRILSFLSPTDPLGFSYNSIQSIIAIGSGMIFGKGLGLGTQSQLRFLPEHHTDFIFAALTEGLGLFGTVVIVACFCFLLYKIFVVFLNANDVFCKVFSSVCFFVIGIQFFVNIGMNIGILPIVGITLPFMSYGGSSLLSNFIFLGILSAVRRSSQTNKALEIK